jgi:TonB family protein
MARYPTKIPRRVCALLILGWTTVLLAGAESGPSGSQGVLLSTKDAARLLVSQIKPVYPPLAKLNFIQGHVRLQLVVTPQGVVREAHVVRGHPILAASAMKAIRRWVYRPFITRSVPMPFETFVDVNFALKARKVQEFPLEPELDLRRQIQPPAILGRPPGSSPASVRLRVLVSDEGKAIDSQTIGGLSGYLEAAREKVKNWNFRPAHYGNLAVPWYLDVDVPVENLTLPAGATDPDKR